MIRSVLLTAVAGLSLAACDRAADTGAGSPDDGAQAVNADNAASGAEGRAGAAGAGQGVFATAVLRDSAGKEQGEAQFAKMGDDLQLVATVRGLAAGRYGIHIHTTGACDAPTFESAGGHWNPTSRKHGLDNPQGPHAGDMPNLIVDADGRGTIRHVFAKALEQGETAVIDADGSALVVHAGQDDQMTDPSGNSGDRRLCGVITRDGPATPPANAG